MTANYYQNQCWLIMSEVLWHSHKGNFYKNAKTLNLNHVWKLQIWNHSHPEVKEFTRCHNWFGYWFGATQARSACINQLWQRDQPRMQPSLENDVLIWIAGLYHICSVRCCIYNLYTLLLCMTSCCFNILFFLSWLCQNLFTQNTWG